MSTELAIQGLDRDKIDLIKRTVANGTTDLEFELFIHACKRTGLDPLMKQIYAIKRHNNKTNRDDMSIQTGIDGYRLIADRTGQYAGSDEATYMVGEDGYPDVASVTVYKLVGGMRCAFSSSARWSEYYSETSPMWKKMPFLMIGKCAEALALRKAFPAELSGVYTHEEMQQADSVPQEPAKTFAEKFPAQAQAIQEKLKAAPATPATPKIASPEPGLTTSGRWIVPVGRQKGQPVTDQHDDNLDWCLQYYMDKLNATGNETSRYREEWSTAIAEIRAEQLRRYPGDGAEKVAL